jgi:hypothetical protein
MARKFTDDDLQANFDLQVSWKQRFVKKHGHERSPHGQMKLLYSNLLGLALVEQHLHKRPDKEIQLVVAGASPGTHMLVLLRHLSQWMEKRNVRMTLYDPAPLDPELQQIVNDSKGIMQFEPRVFEDRDAEEWVKEKGHDCLVFFSDIRSDIHGKNEHVSADEDKIADDMQAQKTWVETMQPDYCMLKFHAPHATQDRKSVESSLWYLHGRLYEQGYVGLFSAEYRLFCTKADIRTEQSYSTAAIERHAFFHTKFTRPAMFDVHDKTMPYDEAFAAHVSRKAQSLGLIHDAEQLLRDAKELLLVAPMHFSWHHAGPSRVDALLVRMLQTL